MKLENMRHKHSCTVAIDKVESLVTRVLQFKTDEKELAKAKKEDKDAIENNDILIQKRDEQDEVRAHLMEIKKQVKYIYKTFETDSNYEWMVDTENKVRNDKKTLDGLKAENRNHIRTY